jgi:hypothetical protein
MQRFDFTPFSSEIANVVLCLWKGEFSVKGFSYRYSKGGRLRMGQAAAAKAARILHFF